MALKNHLTTKNTKDNHHELTAFFYIKGSKDYPVGQSISEPFGYDVKETDGESSINSERPIFGSSIRDLYINYPDLLEVTNNYSGYEDTDNLIRSNQSISLNGTRPRLDRDEEYISTLLIKNASSDEAYKTIYPNYEANSKEELIENLNGETTKVDYLINPSAKKFNYRTCVFWQKIFTLLEYIKKYESHIYADEQGNIAMPGFFDDNSTYWYRNPQQAINKVSTLPTLAKYIALFIPHIMPSNSATQNIADLVPKRHLFNPVRTRIIAGDGEEISTYKLDDNYKYGEDEDFKREYSTDVYLDQLWNKLEANANDDGKEMMFDGLDIRITDLYNISCSFSEHTGRLTKIRFELGYKHLTDVEGQNFTEEEDNYETWAFNIYFDPDAFIDSDTTTEQFPVWTYNDLDFDNEFRGQEYQYDYTNPLFNKFDNDYANILVPNTEPDGTPILNSVHGKFVATAAEIESQMLKAVLDKTKSGGYTNYTIYPVKRISPYIGDDGEVVWDPSNAIDQKFYIFYKNVPPTSEQCNTAVYNYLLTLHSDTNNCHGEHRNPDTNKVEFIGHDPENIAETINFLANMYPTLFEATEIYIIPADKKHCTNGNNVDLADYSDPQTYFSGTTPKRIRESIVNTKKEFEQFSFTQSGEPQNSSSTTLKYYPVEVFKIGSIEGSDNGSTSFKFDFPWYAVNKGGNLADNCLTTLEGFHDYKQKMFANSQDPTSMADIFQIIMILLTRNMFTGPSSINMHDPMKSRYGNILGIPITYSIDNEKDTTVSDKYYNKATFVINAVKFIVYAQNGKDFGSTTGRSINLTSIGSI